MWAMRRCSVKDDVGVIRCCFTKGRCWQCPNPALPNRAYCRLHRNSENDFKIKDFLSSSPPSEPTNSNRVSSGHSSSNDNSKKRKRESKKKKKEEKEGGLEGESDTRQQQVDVAEVKADGEAEVIRKVLPNGVITISSPPPKPTYVSPYLTKATKDGKQVRVVIGDQRKFRCKNLNVSSVLTEQVYIREEISCETHQPIEAGDNVIGSEVNGAVDETNGQDNCTEVENSGYAVDETNGKDNSAEVENSGYAVDETNGKDNSAEVENSGYAVDETNGQDNSAEVENSGYYVRQLLPLLKYLNWDQIFELEIESDFQGKLITEMLLPVIECSYDVVFKCNHCQIRIEDMHRTCMKCNYKLCVKCCQAIRHQSKAGGDTTLNSGKCKVKAVVEIHNRIFTCPTSLGGCAEDDLKIKCLVPIGWKKATAEEQDC